MAIFLKWLFPKSRFIFLIRNPYDAYISYLKRNEVWFARWPDEPLNSPEAFGAQWTRLSAGFIQAPDELNAVVLRYEEIISGEFDWSAVVQHVGHPVDTGVLETKIGGSYEDIQVLPDIDRKLNRLSRIVEPLAASMDYHRPALDKVK